MNTSAADMTGADDAGIYKLSDTLALKCKTLDFLPRPWLMIRFPFGKIAAC